MKRHSQNQLARPGRLAQTGRLMRRSHLARSSRRGALLLVVLSMLVLFAMIGLTFVVTAGHFRRAADASLRAEPSERDPSREMDAIAYQLIRGPQVGTRSGILGNDLLRDMYGNVTIEFPSFNAIAFPQPQIMHIRVVGTTMPLASPGVYRPSLIEDYYSGTVLTFTTGAAAGQSHRILRYVPELAGDTLEAVNFYVDREPESNRNRMVNNAADQLARPRPIVGADPGDSFIVNGHPFSGTGIGYLADSTNTNKPGLTMRTRGVNPTNPNQGRQPVALLPNIAYTFPGGIEPLSGLSIEAGGANESYTAPDYQNMYLAYISLDAGATTTDGILPSFHRQDLIDYWARQLSQDDPEFNTYTNGNQEERRAAFRNAFRNPPDPLTIPNAALRERIREMLRRISLRPLQADHPNFTGSNLDYDMFGRRGNQGTGPVGTARWDIDNDLDGIPDSIWIDPGLPIKTDKQGRRYRPLVAILVRDLDALLNVNAHGFYSHLAGFDNGSENLATPAAEAIYRRTNGGTSPAWITGGNTPAPMRLPLGSGYGPADVNLVSLFRPDSTLSLFQNRYAPIAGMAQELPLARPGVSITGNPITSNDPLSRMATIGIPNLTMLPNSAGQFGTPPDRLGHGYTYLDYDGKPRWRQLQASSGFQQTIDDPYEANLYRRENADRHFTYNDLERVLRYEEYDSSQLQVDGDRLLTAGFNTLVRNPDAPNNLIEPARKRRLITSGSWQVPAPARVPVPRDGHQDARLTASIETPTIATLLHERIEAANAGLTEAQVNRRMMALLPPEMLKGEKLDLNRLLEAAPADGGSENVFELATQAVLNFQTGFDTAENFQSGSRFTNVARPGGAPYLPFNPPRPPGYLNPSADNPTSYSASRQLMARNLYILMLLVTDPQYIHPAVDPNLNADQRRELTLRRIAQWAINVVDFRDKDGVMTPFEYDLNPFVDSSGGTAQTTWNVDGNIATNEGDHRRVVWGAEAPDLLITENLAFHDRGTRDTDWDGAMGRRRNDSDPMQDDQNQSLDQYRLPQGSLFMEFYNTRNTTGTVGADNTLASTNPQDLYSPNGQLFLNRVTPNGYPVWRVVITGSELDQTHENVIDEMGNRPETINFQPRDTHMRENWPNQAEVELGELNFRMLPSEPQPDNYEIERIIYFSNISDTTRTTPPVYNILRGPRVFHYRGTSDLGIFPGQYFVVGPRQRTAIGSRPDPGNPDYNIDGTQIIRLTGANSGTFEFPGMPWYPTAAIKPFLGIAVTADFPNAQDLADNPNLDAAWADIVTDVQGDASHDPDGLPFGIGLSISEPLANDYYDRPTVLNDHDAAVPPLYNLFTDVPDGGSEYCPTVPFDTDPDRSFPLGESPELASTGTYPSKENLDSLDFIRGYKTAILQRLANPLSDFHPVLNPYISVDSMPIDLTVFTGQDHSGTNTEYAGDNWDPDELAGEDGSSVNVPFASRERGRRDLETEAVPTIMSLESFPTSVGNLYGMVSRMGVLANLTQRLNQTPPHRTSPRDLPDEHFGRRLRHTLGFVNHNYGAPMGPAYGGPAAGAYVGSVQPIEQRPNDPFDPSLGTSPIENNPFGWLQWSNRPYVSAYELMQVPSSSPQRLLFEYSYRSRVPGGGGGGDVDPYANGVSGGNPANLKAPFGHMLNFFHTSETLAGAGAGNDQQGSHFARVFDFVHVPTPFNDAYKWFPIAANNLNPDYTTIGANDPRIGYLFPFNKRSRFREPGKINLNTMPASDIYHAIFDPRVWGLTDPNPAFAGDPVQPNINFPSWQHFQESRRGYANPSNSALYPSRFSNPFRAASGAEMMPELGDEATPDNRLRKRPTEATILRSRRDTTMPTAATPNESIPLFDYRLADTANASEHRHHNPHANPMFRYQAYQRLGNIAGTQSNVFAVWMTVGYFELEPVAVSAVHPDGWALGEELGVDTGDIKRHRGFYIIDRSIPVGYQPGRDHNVENVIQLKRFIE